MRGEMPIPISPSVPVKNPYQLPVVLGGSANCTVAYGAAEIYAWTDTNGCYTVRQPAADSLPAPKVVLFGGSPVEYSSSEIVKAADFSIDTKPVLVTLDASSDAPAIGSTVGTLSGSWGMKVGNTGFLVTGIASSSSPYVVYVRPAGSAGGGGSASLQIVQAVADGASGVVSTKVMTLKADVSASPNFTLATDPAISVNYFKL